MADMSNLGIPNHEVVGGFTTIVDRRVWKGVVRHKNDKILWECPHVHSRPEYNARYSPSPDLVWEYSALNCGLKASYQWPLPVGEIGLKGTGDTLLRIDKKTACVGTVFYRGHITLEIDGTRKLTVGHSQKPIVGFIDLDNMKDQGGWPDTNHTARMYWATAAALLTEYVWGLTFHLPSKTATLDGPDYDLMKRLQPARTKRTHKDNPFVRPVKIDGRRLYEVVDNRGVVVTTLPHKGRAVRELEKLEAAT